MFGNVRLIWRIHGQKPGSCIPSSEIEPLRTPYANLQHRPCCQWQLTTCGCTSVLSLWAAVSVCARSSEALTADAHAERVDGVLVSRDVGDEVRLALARCGRAVVRLRIGPHVVPAEPARDPSDARPSSSVSCVSMRTAACVASRQPGQGGQGGQAGRTVGRGPRPVQQ